MNQPEPRTRSHQITVHGLDVEVVRKNIKHLHLAVYPPNGRVRVAAPRRVNDEAVRLAVISKLAWIKRQQAKFEGQERQSAREYVSGESHYFQGRRYRLNVIYQAGPPQVSIRNNTRLIWWCGPAATRGNASAYCLRGIGSNSKRCSHLSSPSGRPSSASMSPSGASSK